MTCRIVTIGDLTADFVMPVRFPIEAGQSQAVAWYAVEPGAAGNFLIAGQRLGAQMAAVGVVGGDLYGRYVLDVLRGEGINVEGVTSTPGLATTVVTVLFEPDTDRFSYVWHGGQGEPIPVSETAAQRIEQADALFMQGFTLCESSLRPLVEFAFGSGKPLWFDVGPATKDVPEADRARIRQHARALMTTESELPLIAGGRTGEAAYDFLMDAEPQLLVIKRGADGCRVVTGDGRIDVPALPVVARDLIGAGDCFNEAFIYGTLRGLPTSDAALLANAAGGAKIQKLGTGRSMPNRAEVDAVLKAGGRTLDF
jgi:ribokinase